MTARVAGATVRELPASQLATYAAVPIAFRAASRLVRDLAATTPDALVEIPLAAPFDKDYDATPGMSPLDWPGRYALERWGLFVAEVEGSVGGGVAVAPADDVMPEADVARGSAVLWDLRVLRRGEGMGSGRPSFALRNAGRTRAVIVPSSSRPRT